MLIVFTQLKEIYGKHPIFRYSSNFLQLFFTASNHTEELMAELEEARVQYRSCEPDA